MPLLLVAASVLLTVLAFPPAALWPAAGVMLVPLFVAIERASAARAALYAYAYTAAMGLVIVRWLVHALATEYGVAPVAAWAFTLLLVAAYGWTPGVAAFLYRRLRGPRLATAPLVLGALWTLAEWLRAGPAGLPWILAPHALAPAPLAYQVAELGGVPLVGFALVSANAALATSLVRRSLRPLWGAGALVVLTLAYGAWALQGAERSERPLRVGVVQAAVPQAERFRPGSAERNVLRHVALTRELTSRQQLDLVVWSETAIDTDLDRAPAILGSVAALARETSTPIVTGAPRSRDGRRTNSVVLLTPGSGLVESYDKQRLVPFSEYDPPRLGWLAPLLGPVTRGDPYVPGESRLLRRGPVPLATPICFEITYPDLVRGFRAQGAKLVLNLSNDAWFGRTGYAALHFAHARFRAVELRSWVVRAANTGVSAVVDPRGRLVASLPVFTEGVLHAEVGPPLGPTLYTRFGDAPVLALLGALVVVAGLRAARAADGPAPREARRPAGR